MEFEPFNPDPNPVGSPEEIVAHGYDPAKWGSCAPFGYRDGDVGKVCGCPSWKVCQMPFKGKGGPQNVLYHIRVDTGASAFKETACFNWYSALHHRWKAARAGTSNEDIKLVGYEGDSYEAVETLPKKPGDKTDMQVIRKTVTRAVAKFPHPGEDGSTISRHEVQESDLVDAMEERFDLKVKESRKRHRTEAPIDDDEQEIPAGKAGAHKLR